MPKLKGGARRALVEQREAQILTAAAQVFAHKGYERATIADIARAAGVAEGSIYNYFKNKADLLISIPRRLLQPTLETVSTLEQRDGADHLSPEQALTRLGYLLVSLFQENAPQLRVLFSSVLSMKPATRDLYVEQVVLYVFGRVEAAFQKLIEPGVFRADLNPRLVPRMFAGMLFPTIMLKEILQAPALVDTDYDQVIANAVQVFLHGVLAEPQRGARK
jgi:TetR/AcrR family fatty acid metabolism transcriptional regulator